ncbi:DUF5677 domain-containing protein [Mucilaginibacter sp. AK015]|uniref:DUF5677 domain-containing protein n=1 Tax=Mucilaginibacter sp. AK015 TaxID=2723072 RepID=UPI00160950DF|nr:DUF5677 domain-containing protein [Mucilaginibacter sp. AK015]MBB5396698.1 hypothetical protein [Mucilaginibacter sp. AK015]
MDWQKDKAIVTGAYFGAIDTCNKKLFEIIKPHGEQLREVFPLIEYIIDRVSAVTVLTQGDLLWDADIIVRSALETLVKFAFIADAEESERPMLLHEFWYALSEIHTLKLSDQAQKNLKHTGEEKLYKLAYSPQVLSAEEEQRLRNKWNKTIRKQLEQKWSFSEIVRHLSSKHKGTALESIEFVTHTYRMSSHVAHGDEIGINMIRERESRSEKEKADVSVAHYLRLLSDSFHYCYLTALYTVKYVKADPTFFTSLSASLREIHELTAQYHMAPFNDPDYDKFR